MGITDWPCCTAETSTTLHSTVHQQKFKKQKHNSTLRLWLHPPGLAPPPSLSETQIWSFGLSCLRPSLFRWRIKLQGLYSSARPGLSPPALCSIPPFLCSRGTTWPVKSQEICGVLYFCALNTFPLSGMVFIIRRRMTKQRRVVKSIPATVYCSQHWVFDIHDLPFSNSSSITVIYFL